MKQTKIKEALPNFRSNESVLVQRLSPAPWYSLPVKGMLTGQNSQFVFDLEVFQTHGARLLCEQQTGCRQTAALNQVMLRWKRVFRMTFIYCMSILTP